MKEFAACWLHISSVAATVRVLNTFTPKHLDMICVAARKQRTALSVTHLLVGTILGALAGGDAIDIVLEDYPHITREDIVAALAFAGELSQFEDVPYELEQA